jgi:hypothetical protein
MSRRSVRRLRGYKPAMDLQSAVHRIYARHAAGCCLHIVLDDSNLEQRHIEFCARESCGHEDCKFVCSELMRMTDAERAIVVPRLVRAAD